MISEIELRMTQLSSELCNKKFYNKKSKKLSYKQNLLQHLKFFDKAEQICVNRTLEV